MTNPTPEQVEEAKAYLKQWADHTASCRAECEHTILAALEVAKKERDRLENDLADALDCKKGDGPTAFNMLVARANRAEARVMELEPVLYSIIDHYNIAIPEKCLGMAGKPCDLCQDILYAKRLLRLQLVDTATLRDSETTKEQ